ncbi:hypothetical protein FB45DRAFT_423150 [Roridomyces roridus]|uniref:Uncharacterized protein n=1 Tax=Roridomyces roridus TaxID=1738132 RepID=A0AAD7C5L9_9AGAR|nr:hypothetical protein FB45DRAFT_423150 [Roridomyces roridus]
MCVCRQFSAILLLSNSWRGGILVRHVGPLWSLPTVVSLGFFLLLPRLRAHKLQLTISIPGLPTNSPRFSMSLHFPHPRPSRDALRLPNRLDS